MSHLDSALQGLAPRNLAGWRALERVLADDEWHDIDELAAAANRVAGLAPRTVRNMIGNASSAGLLERRREPGTTRYRWSLLASVHLDVEQRLIDTPRTRPAPERNPA